MQSGRVQARLVHGGSICLGHHLWCRLRDSLVEGVLVKALVLNGVGKNTQHLDNIGETIMRELRSLRWEAENLILRDIEIAPCMGCFGCWVQTPGVCLIDDAARESLLVWGALVAGYRPPGFA